MTLEGHRREILVLARTGYVVLRIEPAPLACLAPLRVATGLPGVVCGKGRNPTLRLWPAIFSGEIDVFPGDRRSRLISRMPSVAPA
ncbi:hypothetical protein D3227_40380 [Mesorhizobium waimense]|uniref:Uncharacterized protein n=2 Tax=Pseudomonadota TaxID=1224 RepID=A0A3A5JKK8_9HYPH|nr:hypothetical protein D3227_40380 [Mesorhizobium waimense]